MNRFGAKIILALGGVLLGFVALVQLFQPPLGGKGRGRNKGVQEG